MIVGGTVTGKIDRKSGIVSFSSMKDPSEALNDWNHNLNKLMGLIKRTTHLINKEEMVSTLFSNKSLSATPSTSTMGPTTAAAPAPMPMEVD